MRHLLTALMLLLIGVGIAMGADVRVSPQGASVRPEIWRYDRQPDRLPFARTSRAHAVYAANACWTGCQSYCTWDAAACLQTDAQGRCLKLTDKCDRYCQRECRTGAGPLAAFEMPWD